MSRKLVVLLQKIAIIFMVFLFGVLLIGSNIAYENAPAINTALGTPAFKVENIETDPDAPPDERVIKEELEYYPSRYEKLADLIDDAKKKAEEVMGEGVVLLKNEKAKVTDTAAALPLAKGSKVSLVSTSSVDPVYGGTGSGLVDINSAPSFKVASERHSNMEINSTLWNYYMSFWGTTANPPSVGHTKTAAARNNNPYARKGGDVKDSSGNVMAGVSGVNFNGDIPWSIMSAEEGVQSSITTYGDAAIYVLSRLGGEGSDLQMTGFSYGNADDSTDGDYLRITPKEASILEGLKAMKDAGSVKKIVVLINSANMVSADFIDDVKYGIDAALWIGTPGTVGMYAVGDILVGTVNPSGRLADMFWYDNYKNPVNSNFGVYDYANGVSGQIMHGTTGRNIEDSSSATYVVYQEGIYLGYKYTETRYEDYVTARAKTGTFDYKTTVKYPFGFGKSYTTFEYSNFSIAKTGAGSTSEYNVSVSVKNTGSVAGKEVVQIYLQKPYVVGGVEKAAVELVGYGKTKLLPVGQTDTVTVTVDERLFASYDADVSKTYILDLGNYYLTAATDSHNAVNNILAKKGITPATNDRMDAAGNAALVSNAITFAAGDKLRYEWTDAAKWSRESKAADKMEFRTPVKITNLFDFVDVNKYANKGANSVKYITRNDWEGTAKTGLTDNVVLNWTAKMAEDMSYVYTADNIEYPKFGEDRPEVAAFNLIDMRVDTNGDIIPFDDPLWDTFMDQLKWKDPVGARNDYGLSYMVGSGMRMTGQIPYIAKPQTQDHNGPSGLTQAYSAGPLGLAKRSNDPDASKRAMCYPSTPIFAATYNDKLIEEIGDFMGEEALWAGYAGLYGPGSNIHRSPYSGRNFEYYSEDGFLSGMTCAYQVRGMQSHGMYVYNKHGFLNDQEYNRMGICTWSNEQAIREIYGRAFELPIAIADAKNIMSGFNRIGVIWCGASKALCTDYLRTEIGLDGFICTDMWYGQTDQYMNIPGMLLAGNDIVDGMGTGASAVGGMAYLDQFRPDGGTIHNGAIANALRASAKRIMYTVVHSNAMNGFSANTRIIPVTPWWQTLLNTLTIVTGSLSGVAVAWTVVAYILFRRKAI